MKKKSIFVLVIIIMVSGSALTALGAEASFQGLGDLYGGSFHSEAMEVSADGLVAVGISISESGYEAFRWMASGGMEGLGDLDGGGFYSRSLGVSADGSVVVGFGYSASDYEAFRWENGIMTGLGDLDGGSFYSHAYDVSADGSVVVGIGQSASGVEACYWRKGNGAWEDADPCGLGDLPGGSFHSRAYGLSPDGSVIVGWGVSASGDEACYWRKGDGAWEYTDPCGLGDLPGGGFHSEAYDISADGSTVVGRGQSASGLEAFRWKDLNENGLVDPGEMIGLGSNSIASGVSANGSVVVGYIITASGDEACIWDKHNGIRNLKEVLELDNGLDLTDWRLTRARGISDDEGGFTIVGEGINPDGYTEAWIATICEPEPACWQEQAKLLASDGAAGDYFGVRVSVSGDYAIVTADWDDDKGSGSGSAYAFKYEGGSWVQKDKLLASDGAAGDHFGGGAVSISGDYAILGAIWDDDKGSRSGSAYIFKRESENWAEETKLTPSDGAAYDEFGYSVVISGNYAVVGAKEGNGNEVDSGCAYVFKYDGTNWTQQAKLTASDGAANDRFGRLSMEGNHIVIGAEFDDDNGTNSGSAYIFEMPPGGWVDTTETAKLTALDGSAGDSFGAIVSMNGDYVIVGAYYGDGNEADAGSAYIFKYDGTNWTEQAKLTASDGEAGDFFGYSVSVSGNYAIVGAVYDDDNGSNSGSAYVFKREGTDWIEQTKLTASDGSATDYFGISVAVSANHVVVGAYYDDDNGSNSGSAYVFENTCQPANIAPIADAGLTQTPHIGTLINLDGSASSDPDENYPLAYSWQMVSKPQGSEAELFDSDLVNPSFIPDVNGIYIIELVVTDSLGLESQPDSVVIDTYNTYPVAEAADDQAVIEIGSLIQLDGSQSYDDDGDGITYLWTIAQKPVGSLAVLSDTCAVDPNFIADVHGDYIITLVVTDAFGAVSQPDSMTVSFDNIKPVADAGGNQAVVEGDTVFLDGSDSNDVNGDELSYKWNIVSKPSGSNAALSDSNAVDPSFIADVNGSYVISLIVNDGFEDSNSANVTVMAISNEDAATGELMDAVNTINSFDPAVFKNKNLGGALTNKINAALELIDQGYYIDALDKLQNDILNKTNGCAESEARAPDKNDWIKTCEEQEELYPFIVQAIQYLEETIQ